MSNNNVTNQVSAYRWNPYHSNKSPIAQFELVPRQYFHESFRLSVSHLKPNSVLTGLISLCVPSQEPQLMSSSTMSSLAGLSNRTTSESEHSVRSSPPGFSTPISRSVDGVFSMDEIDGVLSRRSSFNIPVPQTKSVSGFKTPPQLQASSCKNNTTAKYYETASGSDLLRILRGQPSDAAITDQIMKLSQPCLDRLCEFLLSSPQTVSSLCKRDRGNVVVHLFGLCSTPMSAAIEPHLDAIFKLLVVQFPDLMLDKLGALALTRLYDLVPCHSMYRHTLDALTLSHFDRIVCHPYGNFLISQIIKTISTASPETSSAITNIYCNEGERFMSICVDKFGSHTAEIWAQHAPIDKFQLTMAMLLKDLSKIALLANSLTGNNPLQNLLQRLYSAGVGTEGKSSDTPLAKMWRENRRSIANTVRDCAFEKMVVGSLNGRSRPRGNKY